MNQIVIFLAVLVAVSASSVYRPPTRYGASHHGGRIVHGGSGGGGFIGGGSFGGSGYGGSGIGTQIIRGPLVHQRLNEYASLSDFSHIGGGGHGVGGGIVHGGFGGRGHGIGGSIGRIHHGGGGYGRPRVTYH